MAEFFNHPLRNPKMYKRRRITRVRDYKVLYRFTQENVAWLCQYFFGDDRLETRGGAISNECKLMCFLRYIGDPGFQSGVGEDLGIHQSSVSKIIIEMTNLIYERAADWIKLDKNGVAGKYEFSNCSRCAGLYTCEHQKTISTWR